MSDALGQTREGVVKARLLWQQSIVDSRVLDHVFTQSICRHLTPDWKGLRIGEHITIAVEGLIGSFTD